jgi:hypothetical protein
VSAVCTHPPGNPGAPCLYLGNPCTLDTCDGTSADCPAGNAGALCRPAADVCDVAETCNGSSTDCPADGFLPNTIVCRAASAGAECDLAETCTGSSAACPADGFQPSTVICRPPVQPCDAAEHCTGSSLTCPGDELLTDGSACDDGNACTQIAQCAGGTCIGSSAPNCDDANLCTQDFCDTIDGCQHAPAPATGCKTAQKSLLLLKRKSGDASKDKLLWKWIRGQATTLAELQDPTSTAPYGLCIYDAATQLIVDVNVPPSPNKWSPLSDKGFKFVDLTGAEDGAQRVVLKSSDQDTAKALMKGKGSALPDPPLGALDLPLTVQLINGETGACLEASYDTVDVVKDDAHQFKAKK